MPSVFGSAAVPFIGCVALLAAAVLTILAFASPYWAEDEKMSFGLWRMARCTPGSTGPDRQDCRTWDFHWDGEDWQLATRGLESLAIIFFAIPLVVLPVYIYVALGLYYRCIMAFMALSVLLGTVSNIAGVVVFGIKISTMDNWRMDWCLIVCIIGGALGLIAFIILLIATINKPQFAPDKYFASGFFVEQDRNRLYVVETDEPVKVVYPANDPPPATPVPPPATTVVVPAAQEPVVVVPSPAAPVVLVSGEEEGGEVNRALEPDD